MTESTAFINKCGNIHHLALNQYHPEGYKFTMIEGVMAYTGNSIKDYSHYTYVNKIVS